MLEKLKEIALRYEDLQAQLGDSAIYGDSARLASVTRELKELEPVVEAYRAYTQAQERHRQAQELLHDPDFRALAQEELGEARSQMEQLEEQLRLLLLPRDPVHFLLPPLEKSKNHFIRS